MSYAQNTIFIVEDEPELAFMLENMLKKKGYHAKAFTSKDQFEKAIKVIRPTAIITDLRLGVDLGMDLIKDLTGPYPGIPVFVISGFLTKDIEDELDKLNVNQIFSKPFDIDQLLENVTETII